MSSSPQDARLHAAAIAVSKIIRLKSIIALVMMIANTGASISINKLKTVARAVPHIINITMMTEPIVRFTER
jgi:hypothetical protein